MRSHPAHINPERNLASRVLVKQGSNYCTEIRHCDFHWPMATRLRDFPSSSGFVEQHGSIYFSPLPGNSLTGHAARSRESGYGISAPGFSMEMPLTRSFRRHSEPSSGMSTEKSASRLSAQRSTPTRSVRTACRARSRSRKWLSSPKLHWFTGRSQVYCAA
jgi:hypothetical protein